MCRTPVHVQFGLWVTRGDARVSPCKTIPQIKPRDPPVSSIATVDGVFGGLAVRGTGANQSTVVDCTVQANQYRGIVASDGSTVSRCTARANSQHGIQVASSCHIVGNTCELNGYNNVGAGILVLGSRNRIEGNHVVSNDYGIEVTATNNLIIRNSATGNGTNYLFVGAQIFGPTNNLVGPGGVVTNENAWANFAF